MTVNERIRYLRVEEELSQEAFAKKLNLARNSISLIENGARNPSERTLLDIATVFNVNMDWLKTGNGEMYKDNDESIMMLLKAKYNMDNLDIKIIENYLTLSPIERQVFKDFMINLKKTGTLD